jgi:hypothetical protein
MLKKILDKGMLKNISDKGMLKNQTKECWKHCFIWYFFNISFFGFSTTVNRDLIARKCVY